MNYKRYESHKRHSQKNNLERKNDFCENSLMSFGLFSEVLRKLQFEIDGFYGNYFMRKSLTEIGFTKFIKKQAK